MDAVDAAFQAVPRALFLPRADVDRADYDGPIAIGRGQTNSQPRTVAAMLRLLEVLEDHDDVQNVYADFDIDADVMSSLE